eukprot:6028193-Pyramimonas_sp.AAC.1
MLPAYRDIAIGRLSLGAQRQRAQPFRSGRSLLRCGCGLSATTLSNVRCNRPMPSQKTPGNPSNGALLFWRSLTAAADPAPGHGSRRKRPLQDVPRWRHDGPRSL